MEFSEMQKKAYETACLKGWHDKSQQTFGDVINLPDVEDGIIYIVSRMVKDRVPDRPDVLVPGPPVRDAEGRVIGANGLSL